MTPKTLVLGTFCLLLFALFTVPAASAAPEYCVNKSCPDGTAASFTWAGHHADACVIGVQGSCQPYYGDLARVTVDGKTYSVPDPCYTTACF